MGIYGVGWYWLLSFHEGIPKWTGNKLTEGGSRFSGVNISGRERLSLGVCWFTSVMMDILSELLSWQISCQNCCHDGYLVRTAVITDILSELLSWWISCQNCCHDNYLVRTAVMKDILSELLSWKISCQNCCHERYLVRTAVMKDILSELLSWWISCQNYCISERKRRGRNWVFWGLEEKCYYTGVHRVQGGCWRQLWTMSTEYQ